MNVNGVVEKITMPQGTTGGSQVLNSVEDEIEVRCFPTCSVYVLKHLLLRQLGVPIAD